MVRLFSTPVQSYLHSLKAGQHESCPAEGWRSAWRKLTNAIECPRCGELQQPSETCSNQKCNADIKKAKSPIASLRFHDLRHHAITELAESQASDQTITAIAGHVSPRILAHYSHVRLEAKRSPLDVLSGRGLSPTDSVGSEPSYDTNNDTNWKVAERIPAELIEKNGRPGRTRTSDLFRVKNEVATLKPFPHLAFPHNHSCAKPENNPCFDGEVPLILLYPR